MKKISYFMAALCCALLMGASAWGQVQITSTGTPVVENFDTIGTSATATLPTGWRVDSVTASPTTVYASAATTTTLSAGTTGTGALTGTSSGGTYNFGNGVNASATDRAVGFLSSGSYSSPRNLFVQLTNATSSTLTSVTISFDVEKYRSGSRAFNINFFSGTDGTNWTAQPDGNVAYAADSANTTIFNPPTTTTRNVTINNLTIAPGASLYLRWQYIGTGGSTNGQALGIDNFSLTANGGPATPTINVSTTSLADFGNVAVGATSAPKSYTVSGVGLSDNITVNAPADFQISTSSNSGYTTMLVLTQSGGTVSATTIFVRFAPTSIGAKGGNITHQSAGAETKNVAVSGTGVNAYTISGTVTTNTGAPLAGVQVSLAIGETPVASTTTDTNGNYSFTGVAGGNEYIVSPSGAGFTFTPPSRTFSNLGANQTADFTATPQVIISEFRFRGTGGATDEFVELYNQTDQAVGLTGWALISGGTVLHTVTSGSIPARGHYLITGAGYSLPTASDGALTTDIPDSAGIALFNNPTNLATGARLDAAGFSTADPLYTEGGGLTPGGGITSNSEHAYVRKQTSGTPQDTDNNSSDFVLVATDPVAVGNGAVLGAPGAENRTSPTQRNNVIKGSLIDPQCGGFGAATSGCARVRTAAGANPTTAQYGTLRIRRKFTNTTGANVTTLRFRVVGISTLGSPGAGSGQADLRVISSSPADFSVTLTDGSVVPVKGTQVETPPAQPLGGGLNSAVVTITTATPIAAGDSVNIEFTLGVQQEGAFSFFVNVEAITQAPPSTSVHLMMGNPSNATEDVNQPTNYLMIKEAYALSYHRDRGIPNWTSWHLDSTWLGSAPRQNDFRNDPSLPSGWYQVQGTDYSGSGFDRGHMTPSADRTSTIPLNSQTFFMTNMIPQAPVNNQQTWNNMEQDLRAIVGQGNELYIISGGAGTGGVGNNGAANTIAGGKVTVPNSTWKVAIVLPVGTNDVSRVTAATRTIAVIVPNRNDVSTDWRTYRVSVDQVEALTGFDFFSNVEDSVENAIESGVDNGIANPAMKAGATSKGVTITRLR
ncbi:MAG: endonuclease mitochondrial [Pyrinomonadaceae bacterium]|nr:endonuclease mitochondrial [Pyrinomonadaceae bacterium]